MTNKGITRTVLSALVVAMIAIGMIYTQTSTVKAEDYYEYLYVGGELVMYQEYEDAPTTIVKASGDGWTFDGAVDTDRILVLENYQDETAAEYGIEGYYHGVGLTIVVNGNNSIANKEKAGIYLNGGRLTFKGDGKLEVKSADTGIRSDRIAIEKCTLLSHGDKYGMATPFGNVTINDDITTVISSGATNAINGPVRNRIAGRGWDTVDGSDEGTDIDINEDGASLGYLKAQFPYSESVDEYTIEAEAATGGTVAVKDSSGTSVEKAVPGTEITVTATPENGYVLDKIIIEYDGADSPKDITDAGKFSMPASSVIVKATFKKQETPVVTQYTITYDLNGGKLDGQTGKVTKTYEAGAVITLPEPTRDGYTFDYWEGSAYKAGEKYTVNEDHTFKAVWKTAESGTDNKSDNAGQSSGTKAVKTGDESNYMFFILLMGVSLAGLAGMAVAAVRKR